MAGLEGRGKVPLGDGTKSLVQEGRCGLASQAEWRKGYLQLTVLEIVKNGNFFIWPPGGALSPELRLYLPPFLPPASLG